MTTAAPASAASTYDGWFEKPWGAYAFAVETKALLAAAGAVAGRAVLEAGCGTGRFTAELEHRDARAVGVDWDPSMLEIARRRLDSPLVLADACVLPFAGASFDLAFAVTLCEFAYDVAAVLAELARVTRPGGTLVIGSLNPSSPWGLMNRRRFRQLPWTKARFLSRRDLLAHGARHGATSIQAALYAPENLPGLRRLAPALESIGRLAPGFGAFQVLTVNLP